MRITGKDIFYLGALGIVSYVLYRVVNFGDNVGDAFDRFWEGLTFDPENLGPGVQLTPEALEAQQDWIRRGFLEITPDGGTRITPAGEAYIRQQREKIVTGEVVN